MNPPIRAVLFDLDQTLLDRSASLDAFLSSQHARLAQHLGLAPFGQWRERFVARDADGHAAKALVYPAILADFGGDAGKAEALVADYYANFHRHAQAVPGTAPTLALLRSRGLKLGIVSNGETALQTGNIRTLGLDVAVDQILVSQAEGVRKPEAAIFRRAAERLGVAPSDVLFVGDDPVADILGAHAAGMKTAWLRRGRDWPAAIAPLPGAAIDGMAEIVRLLDHFAWPAPGNATSGVLAGEELPRRLG